MISPGILQTPAALFPSLFDRSATAVADRTDTALPENVATSMDNQEFIQAYDEHADAIFRHCYFRVSNREVARDLMQEAYIRVWQYIQKGTDIDNLRAFLYRTANNLIVDHMRKYKRRQQSSLETMQESGFDVAAEEDTQDRIRQSMAGDRVAELIQQIEEPYRSAVILRYIDELSPAEIADMLGVSANVVSVRVNRGLKKLRSLL